MMPAFEEIRIAVRSLLAAVTITMATGVSANEAQTFAGSFAVPVFDSIDENGVDLTTGTWRVRTPTIWIGAGEYRQERGLEWTGEAWTHIDQPSLWRDGSKYIVRYKGSSHEFNGFSSNFSKRAPQDGTTLECDTLQAGDGISSCTFRARNGDKVVFAGFYSSLSNYGPNIGLSALEFGNVGIMEVRVSDVEHGSPGVGYFHNYGPQGGSSIYGYQESVNGSLVADFWYNAVNYSLAIGDQRLRINTPNNGANDEHYLRPRSTTQTVTDDFGKSWTYQFNSDRELTRITQPGGEAAISATYWSSGKVRTITTVAGTWNYAYTTPSSFGTTTVTNPLGEVTYVKYHRDHGYVTEVRDPRGHTTYYQWNGSTRRLDRVTYPEGNFTTFVYDTRGNVEFKTDYSKAGADPLIWQAGYAASCSTANWANCNQPRYVIDPEGNRTDLEYQGNDPGPTKVTYPAAIPGAPRGTVTNEYAQGKITRSATCKTQASCVGSSDEVVTEYKYIDLSYANGFRYDGYISGKVSVPYEETVIADGRTLRTCHQYDSKGKLVSTTPPGAGLASCPTATVVAVPVNSNPPVASQPRTAPTFP